MPLPAAHFRPVQSAVKTANAKVWGVAACPLRAVSALYRGIKPCKGAGAPRHSPKLSLRGAKRRGNLGKAVAARTSHRRPHALPNLTVAAFPAQPLAALPLYGCGVPLAGSDRLVQSHSTAGGHWCTAALPDVSLRGAKRRGNLAVHSWITGRPRRKRNCLPEIAPQGHFLALRAQGATSAVGLLAMTNQGASRHFICATAIPRRPYNITRKLYISDRI